MQFRSVVYHVDTQVEIGNRFALVVGRFFEDSLAGEVSLSGSYHYYR